MLNKQQKKDIVKDLTQKLADAKGVVFSSFQGLPSRDVQELRSTLRKQDTIYKVVKNTLLKRVLRNLGLDTSAFTHKIPLSVSFSKDDELGPAKALAEFAKTHEKFQIVAGILDKRMLDQQQVVVLAALPGKQELRGQLAGVIASPLRGLVRVLSGNLRGLVTVLKAVSEKTAQ